ncbi:MAG: hypothetical protein E7043_08765 [Lentisphaerae bacterium]|nr:hypothetical protein [Lentisphaerota bacterium]
MKLRYGVSVSTIKQLQELPGLPEIDFLEITPALREHPEFSIPEKWKKRICRASGRSEARSLDSLVYAGATMRQEFFRYWGSVCDKLTETGISQVTLGIDWETISNDLHYASVMRDMLRCCFGIAQKHDLSLLLEVRIPGGIAGRVMEFVKFRNSLLLPVKNVIDLHPHEPGALASVGEIFEKLPFDCSNFRVSVDVSGGNCLTGQLLERIKKCLCRIGPEVPEICFYPGSNADKTAYEQFYAVIGS